MEFFESQGSLVLKTHRALAHRLESKWSPIKYLYITFDQFLVSIDDGVRVYIECLREGASFFSLVRTGPQIEVLGIINTGSSLMQNFGITFGFVHAIPLM